jgi:hypothetical protein
MIHYLTHNQIDINKWDHCIRHAFNGNIYAYSWYLDRVHPDWEALVEDDYVRVMPLTGAKKYGIWYLFQPFFTQQLGVFSTSILTADVCNTFLMHIPAKFRFVQIQLNSHNHPSVEKWNTVPKTNYLLDLISDYRKLNARYNTNTKRNLKKAERSAITISKGLTPGLLIDLFRTNKGKQIKHWKESHYRRLERLMYEALTRNAAVIYGAYSDRNELCAGAFFLKTEKTLTFLFSATSTAARQTGAMTLLIDTLIREGASSERILDFEGSNQADLARFYKGFGAREEKYTFLEINNLPLVYRWVKQAQDRLKFMCKK